MKISRALGLGLMILILKFLFSMPFDAFELSITQVFGMFGDAAANPANVFQYKDYAENLVPR